VWGAGLVRLVSRCSVSSSAVRYGVLQCVAVWCSALQCVAVRCNVLQYGAPCIRPQCSTVCCSVLQCVTVRCNALQCVAVCCSTVLHAFVRSAVQCVAVCCSVLQCVAVCCSVLQCVAVRCSMQSSAVWYVVLQCVAVCCRVTPECYSVLQCVAMCCSTVLHAIVRVNGANGMPNETQLAPFDDKGNMPRCSTTFWTMYFESGTLKWWHQDTFMYIIWGQSHSHECAYDMTHPPLGGKDASGCKRAWKTYILDEQRHDLSPTSISLLWHAPLDQPTTTEAVGTTPIPTASVCIIQSGEDSDAQNALNCRSLSAKESLIIGLFCGKWSMKLRHHSYPRYPVRSFPVFGMCPDVLHHAGATFNLESHPWFWWHCI